MKKVWLSVILSIMLSVLLASTALASSHVFDVTVSSLNIRSGPGLSYSIIAQVSSGEDLPEYPTGTVSANGYTWMKVYYPNGGLGQYSSSAVGWGAWYYEVTPISFNFDYSTGVTVIKSSGIYEYQYPNLTSPYPTLYSYGQNIGCYDSPYNLQFEPGYPNAWRLYRLDGTYDLGYGNGWHVTALHR